MGLLGLGSWTGSRRFSGPTFAAENNCGSSEPERSLVEAARHLLGGPGVAPTAATRPRRAGDSLIDGATTNLWALSTQTGEWRQLTDFGERNVVIARRVAWSRDGEQLYASVSDVDFDIVLLDGLVDRH